eukprot:NODE_11_length_54881_cov_1.430718.p45 type:complete len:103 gc:universal NODE_11_length_54881_cov_1.430718:28937-29245(+)
MISNILGRIKFKVAIRNGVSFEESIEELFPVPPLRACVKVFHSGRLVTEATINMAEIPNNRQVIKTPQILLARKSLFLYSFFFSSISSAVIKVRKTFAIAKY